jgi:hypothetical protein
MHAPNSSPEPLVSSNSDLELRRIALDEWKAQQEHQIRLREIELKESESHRTRWANPLVLSVIAASIAAGGNAYISWLNGANQLAIESTRNASTRELEKERAEATRILEATKAATPKDAAAKIRFLIDVGLISDPNRRAALEAYLQAENPVTLPMPNAAPKLEEYVSGWLGGGNNQADQCGIGRAIVVQKYPGKSVILKSSSEESKRDFFGHVEYQYFCVFEIR